MKLAVSSTGPDLDSQVDLRFGRCQYFIIVDPESMEFEAIENPNIQAPSGAGIATAQMVAQRGIEAVITGNVGPNAYQTLSAAGVKIIVGASGRVREAVEQYKKGQLKPTAGPSVGAHFGVGMYPGMGGFGPGMGAGMGIGRGMGMGRGAGMGWGMGMMGPVAPQISKEQELAMLKNQVQALEQQLRQIETRIKELEKEKK